MVGVTRRNRGVRVATESRQRQVVTRRAEVIATITPYGIGMVRNARHAQTKCRWQAITMKKTFTISRRIIVIIVLTK